ncbi:MAG: hypothetical protein LBU35_01295 [Holosporales bacterium]|jgi:hypothetical protein|nr:hypothetical protein [Holosporales bacterium]
MIIEQLSNLLSYIGNPYFISVLAIILFVFSKKYDSSGLIYLLFFTMIYNVLLKYAFKFPLPESCPAKGYGFPSGHMNFNSVFFLWIFSTYKKPIIRIFSLLSLAAIGWNIVYKGFHYARDVLLTPPFACLCIFIYRKFIEDKDISRIFLTINLFSAVIILGLYFINGFVHWHIFMAYYIIIGFGLSRIFFEELKQKIGFSSTISQTIKSICILLGILIICVGNETKILYHILEQAKWFFLGIFLPAFKYLFHISQKDKI